MRLSNCPQIAVINLALSVWPASCHEVFCHPAGPHTALDGDVLCHFLYLPAILQQQLLSAMLAAQAARQTCEGNPNSHMPVSLSDLVRVLESTLPVC